MNDKPKCDNEDDLLRTEVNFDPSLIKVSNTPEPNMVNSCVMDDEKPNSGNIGIYISTKVLDCWQKQHDADRTMREKYAKQLMWVLYGQLGITLLVFIGIGLKWLSFSDFTINLFVSVAYAQVLGLVYVVVHYLFSRDGHIKITDVSNIIGQAMGKKVN